jgi:hypothetical protein
VAVSESSLEYFLTLSLPWAHFYYASSFSVQKDPEVAHFCVIKMNTNKKMTINDNGISSPEDAVLQT